MAIEPISLAAEPFFGPTGEGNSLLPGQAAGISADGQLVVFQSSANDLVPNDANKASNSATALDDVFLFNRSTGETTLISVNVTGTGSGNNSSFKPKISPDGRYIVFESEASNLTTESIISGSGHPDLFLRDLQAGNTTLVSKNLGGTTGGNLGSFNATISPDGRFVIFESHANNLVANDTNDRTDIFLRDLQNGTTTLISRTQTGASGNGNSFDPRISDDNRFIAFTSFASDLVSNDGTNVEDVFVHDLQTGATELISTDSNEVNQSNAHNVLSPGRAISADGRYVIFETNANNLVPQNATFEGMNVYLRDRQLGTTTVITVSADGNTATGGLAGSMTADGRFVAFVSREIGLVAGLSDTNGAADVFLRDLQTGTTRTVSLNATGTGTGNRASGTAQYPFDFSPGAPVLSADARYVAFASEASNLVSGLIDNNDSQTASGRRRDVFLRDMQSNSTTLISLNRAGTGTGDNGSYTPAMSADGSVIAFESNAGDLTGGQDNTGFLDVFVRDHTAGDTELASQRSPLLPREELRGGTLADATADGRYVAFLSGATLVPNVPLEFGQHLYVRDRVSGQVTVEDAAGGVAREGNPRAAQLSDDGRFVVFSSSASLDPTIPNPERDVQLYVRDRQTGVTRTVTATRDGQASEGVDFNPREFAFSADGRYVAFTTQAADFVNGFIDNNGSAFGLGRDIFLRDLDTATTRLVSHLPGNATGGGNGTSFWPLFSPDGSKLAFVSLATDLAAGVADTNTRTDLFVYDVATGEVDAATVTAGGDATGNGASGDAGDTLFQFSADGRQIFFGSAASDLVAADTNDQIRDIFRRDLIAGTTTLVSVSSGGIGGNNRSYNLSSSRDGNLVFFSSDASNLLPGDTNNRTDAFLRNIAAGTTTRISTDTDGSGANDHSFALEISPDGSHVAMLSHATNLVPNLVDINGQSRADLFVRRISDGVTVLATVGHTGLTGNDTGNFFFSNFEFSEDGEHLFFDIDAANLFNGDRNFVADVFAYSFAGAGQIRGQAFHDDNGNSMRDAGEDGLAHWTAYLDANGNSQFDPGEENVQSNISGDFAFTGLAAGVYTVALELLPDFAQTLPNVSAYTVTLADDRAIEAGRDFAAQKAQIDLLVEVTSGPPIAAIGEEFVFGWSARNDGAQPIIGNWQDAVYLSQDNVLDASDRLLGTVPHIGGLVAGTSYVATLRVPAPRVDVGDYRIILQLDRRSQVANDANRSNNVSAFQPIALSIPQLTIGTPLASQFAAPNQSRYYQIIVPPGQSMLVTLDSLAAGGSTELFVRRGNLPTPWEFDLASRTANQPDQELVVPLTEAGTYFVLAQSREGDAATGEFTVTASLPGFSLRKITANQGTANTQVTVRIEGTAFTQRTQVSLVRDAGELNAVSTEFRDSSVLYATFNLTGPGGVWDLRATDENNVATLEDAFEIVKHTFGQIDVHLIVPEFVRQNREGTAVIQYANRSGSDVAFPKFELAADGALLRLPEHASYSGSSLSFLGTSQDGPTDILRPGKEEQVVVRFLATQEGDTVDFRLFMETEPDAVLFIAKDAMKYRDIVRINQTAQVGDGQTQKIGSFDPNDITGPAGFSDQNFIQPDGVWPYIIRFENDPLRATAPAQEVFITHQLDADLDWSSFELSEIGFGSQILTVPAGVQSYETRVEYQNQDDTPLLVDVAASLDLQTGVVTWIFRSVDPATGTLPGEVFAGFLPVNDTNGRGEGFVTYLIEPKSDLATGTMVSQQASIVFDVNPPIVTNTYTNTVDAGLPNSSTGALPTNTMSTTFSVSWAGFDDTGGSGIASYDVFVSDNGGPYTLFKDNTTDVTATFTGVVGHTYRFYSVATDNVGNAEAPPAQLDAATTIIASPLTSITGTDGNDTYHIVRVGSQLNIYENTPLTGAPTYSSELSAVGPTLAINTLGGEDMLVVDAGANAAELGAEQLIYVGGSGTNTLVLKRGTARIDSTAASGTLNTTVQPGAHLTTNRLMQNDLTLADNSRVTLLADGGTNVVTSLALGNDATLDIGNNAVVIDYTGASPLAATHEKILSGRGGPGFGQSWTGPGITSSAVAQANQAEPESRSVGYAENASLPLGPYTIFRGQRVDDTSILVAFTHTADVNLDGIVGDDDVTVVSATYAPTASNPRWSLADFDYSGSIDDDDVTLLGVFYNPAAAPPIAPGRVDNEIPFGLRNRELSFSDLGVDSVQRNGLGNAGGNDRSDFRLIAVDRLFGGPSEDWIKRRIRRGPAEDVQFWPRNF